MVKLVPVVLMALWTQNAVAGCAFEWSKGFSQPMGVPWVRPVAGALRGLAVGDHEGERRWFTAGNLQSLGIDESEETECYVFDGASWESVGVVDPPIAGLGAVIYAIEGVRQGGTLPVIVGGRFSAVDNVVGTGNAAVFRQQNWEPVGPAPLGGRVITGLHVQQAQDHDVVYAFGIAGLSPGFVVRWDGDGWTTLLDVPFSGGVTAAGSALFDEEPALVIGTDLDIITSGPERGIFQYTGGSWQRVGSSTSWSSGSNIRSIIWFAGHLYALGDFDDNPLDDSVLRWDGVSWQSAGPGADCSIQTAAVVDNYLVAAGSFPSLGSDVLFAKFDGAAWAVHAAPINGLPSRIVPDPSDAIGDFVVCGGISGRSPDVFRQVGRWNGERWEHPDLDRGLQDCVRAIGCCNDEGSVIVVGDFHEITEPIELDRVGVWSQGEWSTAGSLPGVAHSVAVTDVDHTIAAGGEFGTAIWNGESWDDLGVDGVVNALVWDETTDPPTLYAGGDFLTADGVAASRIAKWDGTSWSPLGAGVTDTVHALRFFDDGSGRTLYVGGEFDVAGEVVSRLIARWDGAQWEQVGDSALRIDVNSAARGGSVPDAVYALEAFDDGNGERLYVGGSFVTIAGIVARRIAAWDGQGWASLGQGTDAAVHAMKAFEDGAGSRMFVGGEFATAGGLVSSRLATWSGGGWGAIEDGPNGTVRAIETVDPTPGAPQLWIGGDFTRVGGDYSAHIGMFEGCPMAPESFSLVSPTGGVGCVGLEPTLEWQAEPNADSYRIVVARDAALTDIVLDEPAVMGTSLAVPPGLLDEGRAYWWGAVASNATADAPSTPSSARFVTTLLGDVNGDGSVGFSDLNAVVVFFGEENPLAGDLNGDGVVDFSDLNEVLVWFGESCD